MKFINYIIFYTLLVCINSVYATGMLHKLKEGTHTVTHGVSNNIPQGARNIGRTIKTKSGKAKDKIKQGAQNFKGEFIPTNNSKAWNDALKMNDVTFNVILLSNEDAEKASQN